MRRQMVVGADKYDVVWAINTFPVDTVPLVLDRLQRLHAAGIYGGEARLAVLAYLPAPAETTGR